jgi:two-component system chemotaxis response regulator CheB
MDTTTRIRVLVVDDSVSYGSMIKRALEAISGVTVIGRATNGRDGLERIRCDSPDLVTLDLEMPEMSGIEMLRSMRRQGIHVPVVVLSAIGDRQTTIEALELGALDFLSKPEGGDAAQNLAALRATLDPLISAVRYRKEVRGLLNGGQPGPPTQPAPAMVPIRPAAADLAAPDTATRIVRKAARRKPVMVLIGGSTGGTEALARIVPLLPRDLGVPVLVVQHMPPLFTENLATSLNARSQLSVREGRNGELAAAGNVYIAPGGSHMKIMAGMNSEIVVRITSDPPENNCRPAVDYLFRSAATAFPGGAVAVILTGMGRDGTLGLRLLKASGCFSIAQNEATCAVFGMPKEAIQAGVVDLIVPVDSIAGAILSALQNAGKDAIA